MRAASRRHRDCVRRLLRGQQVAGVDGADETLRWRRCLSAEQSAYDEDTAESHERRHAGFVVHVRLILRDLGKDGQLLGLLKSAEAECHRACLRRHDDHRRMRPERCRRRGHKVRDAGAILRDADAMLARHACVPVGHVPAALLVRHRNEADAGEGKEIERIHVRGPHDAEHIFHTIRDERFDERFRWCHLVLAGNGEMG